jgi:hypothetical protein
MSEVVPNLTQTDIATDVVARLDVTVETVTPTTVNVKDVSKINK